MTDMFPGYVQKLVPKGLQQEAGKGGFLQADVDASNTIKQRLYRECNGLDAEEDLPANWMNDMQLPWETNAGQNNMASLNVHFAPIIIVICPFANSILPIY